MQRNPEVVLTILFLIFFCTSMFIWEFVSFLRKCDFDWLSEVLEHCYVKSRFVWQANFQYSCKLVYDNVIEIFRVDTHSVCCSRWSDTTRWIRCLTILQHLYSCIFDPSLLICIYPCQFIILYNKTNITWCFRICGGQPNLVYTKTIAIAWELVIWPSVEKAY